jgi:hypothetical protein
LSGGQRLGLIGVAVAIAVIAFVALSPGDDDDDGGGATTTTAAQTAPERTTATTPTTPAEPAAVRASIEVRGGGPVGSPKTISATRGERVEITVSVDAAQELHLHGYDITLEATPAKPARFAFTAKLEGVYELESHDTEAKLASIEVKPA